MTFAANPAPYESFSVEALAQRLAEADETVQLIDVREPEEVEAASLPGFVNLPLSEFADWSGTIHSRFECDRETIVPRCAAGWPSRALPSSRM